MNILWSLRVKMSSVIRLCTCKEGFLICVFIRFSNGFDGFDAADTINLFVIKIFF